MVLHTKQWKEEDISGSSKVQYKVMSYYSAMYLALLIRTEVDKGYNTDWSYYITQYNLREVRKELACCKIDLDDILACFQLPAVSATSGVGAVEIESTLIVEPTTLPVVIEPTIVDINELLNNPSTCTSYI